MAIPKLITLSPIEVNAVALLTACKAYRLYPVKMMLEAMNRAKQMMISVVSHDCSVLLKLSWCCLEYLIQRLERSRSA